MTLFKSTFAKVGVAFAAVLGLTQVVSASIVYENSGGTKTPTGGTATEIGDEITLSGTDRIMTEFRSEYFISAVSGNEKLAVYFYNVNGNTIGSEIAHGALTDVTKAGFGTVSVTGLSVTVPDTFVWTVRFQGIDGGENAALILPGNAAASVGSSSANFYWANEGGTLGPVNAAGQFNNLVAQVTAVPEPGTWALMLTGIAGLGAFGYRRKS